MDAQPVSLPRFKGTLFGILFLIGVYLTSLYSYLLFHSVVELFSILVACCVFMIAWNSRQFLENNYLRLVGTAYLFVAVIDLLHTLAYKGMGIFHEGGANLSTQLWISARYVESLSLLIAPVLPGQRLPMIRLFCLYAAVTAALLGSIFYWQVFPVCYADGLGLTPFKRISEYLISLMLLGAGLLLWLKREQFDNTVLRFLIGAILITVCSELAFTLYVSVYGFANLLGHFLKLISFYLIYKAIIETGFVSPYALLLRELKQRDRALRHSESRHRSMMESMPDPAYVCSQDFRVQYMNPAMMQRIGADAVGKKCHEALHGLEDHCPWCIYGQIRKGETVATEVVSPKDGLTYQVSHSPVHHADGTMSKMAIYRDITRFKEQEAALQEAKDGLERRVQERTAQLSRSNRRLRQEVAERRQAEEALRTSERNYSNLVESSLTGIFMIQDQKIVFANQQFAAIYGYSKEEVVGADPTMLTHPEERRYIKDLRESRLRGQSVPTEYETRGIKKSGETIWVQRRVTVTDHNERPAILGNIVDITKRKEMEETLRQSERQLHELSSALFMAQERERKRIALELHDGVAQSIAAVKFGLESKLSQMDKLASPKGISLETIIAMVQNAIEETRRIMTNLRPPMLDDLGILPTINWWCREMEAVYTGIHVRKQVHVAEADIPQPLKIVIYRVLQEALNNVVRHSGAKAADLTMDMRKGRLELMIRDDGEGFDVQAALFGAGQPKGLGLAGMRERTERSGGSFSLESSLGAGTTIRASWPCNPQGSTG